MTFEEWYNDADMHTKINGEWVDLETGIPFHEKSGWISREEAEKRRTERIKKAGEKDANKDKQSLSTRAKMARIFAKSFGGQDETLRSVCRLCLH